MGAFLANFIFTNPLVLLGFLALPAILYLLRTTPPPPRRIFLPTVQFLKDLVPDQQTPSKTPLWLLLLRMLIIALIITALAGPVYNPGTALNTSRSLTLVIDNGWSAAPNWEKIRGKALDLMNEAERVDLTVTIYKTAPQPGEVAFPEAGPLPVGEASALLRAMTPLPWPADHGGLRDSLSEENKDPQQIIWLSDGIMHAGSRELVNALQARGNLNIFTPDTAGLPMALSLARGSGEMPDLTLHAPPDKPGGYNLTIQAMSENGNIVGFQDVLFKGDADRQTAGFDLNRSLQEETLFYRLEGQRSAGGVVIADESLSRKSVGIVTENEQNEGTPLIDAVYYLRRALQPYADLSFGDIDDLLDGGHALIILPDIAGMPIETLNALQGWVEEGGLLLRFAGPNMTRELQNTPLLPVPLRRGGRNLQGALSWEEPLKIAEFDAESPFYGLDVPAEVTVRTQILADPGTDLDGKIWASLEDGTPLITADTLGQGRIVLFHTTSSAEWSDLALSGLFVNMLRRVTALAGAPPGAITGTRIQTLDPVFTLDGFGRRQSPPATVEPLSVSSLDDIRPEPSHPPGLYGRAGIYHALNIGHMDLRLRSLEKALTGTSMASYDGESEFHFTMPLLYAAGILFLLDWLIMIAMSAGIRRASLKAGARLSLVMMVIIPAGAAYAQDDIDYANGLYLAYISSSDPSANAVTRQALENLAVELRQRTSAEPDGVAALDPARDSLAFFPWIYWPASSMRQTPSAEALRNIQSYLDNGGTIFFDLQDGVQGAGPNTEALRRITNALNIPPLMPAPDDHVLRKTFYLLDNFPGRYNNGQIWVERSADAGRDGVSPVLIGSSDWATAWAMERSGSQLTGGSRQREMAIRTGVNIMMYALTGNYKQDQVHIPYILERLER